MKKILLSATALSFALTASAFAADLPSYKAPLIAPPPAFSWTGLYGGVNIGYGFGNGDPDSGDLVYAPYSRLVPPFPCAVGCAIPIAVDPGNSVRSLSSNLNGVLGGGQAGYNYQFNPWLVVGLEADIQATDVHSQGNEYEVIGGFFGPHVPYALSLIHI